jgi:muramidase (phage lysozyme)
LIVAGFILLAVIVVYKQSMPSAIDPTAYTPLLNTIAKGESNGNYNAYFGNAANTTLRFTNMTLGEVLHWQEEYVRQGSASSAVGKYQIVRPTLAGLVRQLQLDLQAPFDEALQDRLAIALLERRGALAFAEKKLTREQFAANLAQEWAALPKVTGSNPNESYYAGDGLNKSNISIDEVYKALANLES